MVFVAAIANLPYADRNVVHSNSSSLSAAEQCVVLSRDNMANLRRVSEDRA